MTTLYRTPNLILDRHEWHAVVMLRRDRPLLTYKWRPLCDRPTAWQDVTAWKGPKPKGLTAQFWRFRGHIREAMGSTAVRRDALRGIAGKAAPDWSRVRVPGRRASLGLAAA